MYRCRGFRRQKKRAQLVRAALSTGLLGKLQWTIYYYTRFRRSASSEHTPEYPSGDSAFDRVTDAAHGAN